MKRAAGRHHDLERAGRGAGAAGRRFANIASTAIYPGFPTDLQAPFSLVLCAAEGVSTINENLYEDRFDYTLALQQMGAKIHVFDAHTGVFHGPNVLHGSQVEIPDLRAGATLVLAALAAEGQSQIAGIEHVARGYEDMVGKLSRWAPASPRSRSIRPKAPAVENGQWPRGTPGCSQRPSAVGQ